MTGIAHILHIRHGAALNPVRAACAAVAAIVVVDAVAAGAPGLAIMAVPFVIASLSFTHGTAWGSALVAGACALYVAVGVNLIVSSGTDAAWGDLLFALAGTPLAAFALYLTIRSFAHHRS